jgi:hypothetical protein
MGKPTRHHMQAEVHMTVDQVPRYAVTIDGETVSIGTANELSIALDVLQGRRDREVLEQLAPHLAEITSTPAGFLAVLKSLAPADQIFVIEALGPSLAGILREARHLRDLLATTAEVDVERRLLETLGAAGLRAVILTAEELGEVLEWTYGQCERELLDLLGSDYLRSMARSGYELACVLNAVDPAAQDRLLEQFGRDRVVALIHDGCDLAYLLRALPPAESGRLLDHFSREQLVEIIGNASDWKYVTQRLEPAEVEQLLRKLEVIPHAA